MAVFYYRSTCTTCRRARALLRELGVECDERDLSRSPFSYAELRDLVGEQDITLFLNTRNELYRDRRMKTEPPPRDEAFRLLAAHPTLLRRPLLVDGEQVLFGFDEAEYRRRARPGTRGGTR